MSQKTSKAVLTLLTAGILLTLMAYTQMFGKGNAARVSAFLPFPAASVNGGWVMYRTAFQRYEGLKTFYASEGKEIGEDLEERMFESLLREQLIRQLMAERGVFASEEDRLEALRAVQDQSGSREAFASKVKEMYGWNLRQFERHVVRPFVEARSLEEAIFKDRERQLEKRVRMDEAFGKLEGGAAFDGLVLEYSEDATSVFNGDVGWMTETEMPEAWRGAALHLDAGETSPVLEERDRFVILRVDEREEGSEEEGKELDRPLRVNLSVLIINKVSLSEVVRDFAEESNMKVWVRL